MAISAEARLLDPLDWLAVAAEQGTTPELAWDWVAGRTQDLGADTVGLVAFLDRSMTGVPARDDIFGCFVSDDWHDYYHAHQDLRAHDFMARHLFTSDVPAFFDDADPERPPVVPRTDNERSFRQLVMDFGMRQSLGVSYFDRAMGTMSAFMLTSLHGGNDIARVATRHVTRLSIAVQFFLEGLRLRDLAERDLLGDLTPRESDCLHWAAVGLTTKEIAARLGLSDHTVNEYVASAMRKLGASTRTQAVMRAIALELIAP